MTTHATPVSYQQAAKDRVLPLPNGSEHPAGLPVPDGYGNQRVPAGALPAFASTGTTTGKAAEDAGAARNARNRHRAEPAVPDYTGYDQRPDPLLEPASPAGLIKALNDFRAWAGDPSYREMAGQCGQLASASSPQRTLTGRKLPTLTQVRAIILGCGGTEEDIRRFATAWRRIRLPHQAGRPRPMKLINIGLPHAEAG